MLHPGHMLRTFLLAATLLVPPALHANPTKADDTFLAARDAYVRWQPARLAEIAPRLRGHVLEPYV